MPARFTHPPGYNWRAPEPAHQATARRRSEFSGRHLSSGVELSNCHQQPSTRPESHAPHAGVCHTRKTVMILRRQTLLPQNAATPEASVRRNGSSANCLVCVAPLALIESQYNLRPRRCGHFVAWRARKLDSLRYHCRRICIGHNVGYSDSSCQSMLLSSKFKPQSHPQRARFDRAWWHEEVAQTGRNEINELSAETKDGCIERIESLKLPSQSAFFSQLKLA